MSWALSGTYFENCTCEGACPCTASSLQWPADKDFCDVMFAFHVDSGEIDGTAVEDLSVVLLLHSPQAQITDGNLTVGLYVDERASAEQAEKLGAVFGGQLGGPMAALAPLIGENLGMDRVPMEFVSEGGRHSVEMGDAGRIEITDIVPFGIETGEPVKLSGVFHPLGPELTIAKAGDTRVSAFGLEPALAGQAGFSHPFSWAA